MEKMSGQNSCRCGTQRSQHFDNDTIQHSTCNVRSCGRLYYARFVYVQNTKETVEISALTATKMNSTDGSSQQLLWSTIVPHTSRPNNRGNIRRCYDATVHPQMGVDGCRTMYEGIRFGAKLNPLGPCLGYRAISNTSGMPTPFIYSSYTEVLARLDCFAAGLDTLMLVPLNPDQMKLIGIYLPNCMEWVVTEHAIFALGGATVPMYDTCTFCDAFTIFDDAVY